MLTAEGTKISKKGNESYPYSSQATERSILEHIITAQLQYLKSIEWGKGLNERMHVKSM